MSQKIKDLFDPSRKIDRSIEKVITYSNEAKLQAEVSEYVVTENLEESFKDLLDKLRLASENPSGEGGHEIGVWVSGFYGSGKSSFTKYLGFALDRNKKLGGRLFLEHLQDRLRSQAAKALFGTVSKVLDAHVVFLDLASEMSTGGGMAEVSVVLRNKVLRDAGYANDIKVAELEIMLEKDGKFNDFKTAAQQEMDGAHWEQVHNQPLVANTVGARLAHRFYPGIWKTPEEFANVRIDSTLSERDRVVEMVDLVKRKSGKKNIIFVVDEVGQYVAAKNNLILNLDGFAKSLKEIGQGTVWLFATAQQTLTEDNRQASINSPDLYKLKDRFPIRIHLEASDIKEICTKRLLGKSSEGATVLDNLFGERGASLRSATQLRDAQYYDSQLNSALFRDLYPFLPSHFEILLQLLGKLAKRTGGLGLRSAIKVLQDMLLDKSNNSLQGSSLSERTVGSLATTVTFFDGLEREIISSFPAIVDGVQRVKERFIGRTEPFIDVAKTIAILQIIENLPATVPNVAALIQPDISKPSQADDVAQVIREMLKGDSMVPLGEKDGRLAFLSKAAVQFKSELEKTEVRQNELRASIHDGIKSIFSTLPLARVADCLSVQAGIKMLHRGGSPVSIHGDKQTLQWFIDLVEPDQYEGTSSQRLIDSHSTRETLNLYLLARNSQEIHDAALDSARCSQFLAKHSSSSDQDVKDFLRQVEVRLDTAKDTMARLLRDSMLKGSFIHKGHSQSVESLDQYLDKACNLFLAKIAAQIYSRCQEANHSASTNLAETFLRTSLPLIGTPQDPLSLVQRQGGRPMVNQSHKALISIRDYLAENGGVEGNQLLEHFSSPPFGWSKDTTRYLVAGLLTSGSLKLRISGSDHFTRNDEAIKSFASNRSFGTITVDLRDARPDPELLMRTRDRLDEITGTDVEVLPLEEEIAKVAKLCLPGYQIEFINLANKLGSISLLDPSHGERAKDLAEQLASVLKGDGTDAISRFGKEESPLYKSVIWARKVGNELKVGLENTLLRLVRVKEEWALVPPGESTGAYRPAANEALAKVTEILSGENFYNQYIDLQGLATELEKLLMDAKSSIVKKHNAGIEQTLASLVQSPEFQSLHEDHRKLVQQQAEAGKINSDFSEKPINQVVSALYQASSTSSGLNSKVSNLVQEATKQREESIAIPRQDYEIQFPEFITNRDQITSIVAELEKLKVFVDGSKAIRIIWKKTTVQDV